MFAHPPASSGCSRHCQASHIPPIPQSSDTPLLFRKLVGVRDHRAFATCPASDLPPSCQSWHPAFPPRPAAIVRSRTPLGHLQQSGTSGHIGSPAHSLARSLRLLLDPHRPFRRDSHFNSGPQPDRLRPPCQIWKHRVLLPNPRGNPGGLTCLPLFTCPCPLFPLAPTTIPTDSSNLHPPATSSDKAGPGTRDDRIPYGKGPRPRVSCSGRSATMKKECCASADGGFPAR